MQFNFSGIQPHHIAALEKGEGLYPSFTTFFNNRKPQSAYLPLNRILFWTPLRILWTHLFSIPNQKLTMR